MTKDQADELKRLIVEAGKAVWDEATLGVNTRSVWQCNKALHAYIDSLTQQPAELEEARKLELLSAMKPFAELVLTTSGRIPHERLSFANWHDLTKAYKRHRDA